MKEQYRNLIKLASYASVIVAAILIIAKAAAYHLSGSVSILAALIDSLMDMGASLLNLFAVRYALTPPDNEHRFGHGKMESLAGLAQGVMIALSALFLLFRAIEKMVYPSDVEQLSLSIGVIIFSVVLTLALIVFQRYVVSKTDSVAIRADSLHYQTDLLTNISILFALVGVAMSVAILDSLVAIGISAYILWSAYKLAADAIDILMDKELPDDFKNAVLDCILKHPGVLGIHEVKTRRSGYKRFVQLHIDCANDIKLVDAHRISEEVEREVYTLFEDVELIIHLDPISHTETQKIADSTIPS